MKKLTLAFLVLLVLATGGALAFVGLSPDFVEPGKRSDETGLSADNPVWDKSLDDLAGYLVEQGVLPNEEYTPLSDGIATAARGYSGLELYWWDLEALQEDSDEYKAYLGARDDGAIDLWGSGAMMPVTAVRGPFALNITTAYTGDAAKAEQAFAGFCAEETEGGGSDADTNSSD